MPEKRWKILKHDAAAVNALAAELKVRPLIAALLIARGYETVEKAREFLTPSLEHLHDPFLLKGMSAAVDRIQKAAETNEKVLIWGDYDVDGTTGTVLLRKMLSALGVKSVYHVPNRFTEGYGINIPALEQARNDGVSLVISVDCGTTNAAEVEFANSIGLDVIITDHHLPKTDAALPPAVALVNPNQPGCPYPDKDLAGVGVAFKVAQAVLQKNGRENEVSDLLKIAAIGTVADMMNLKGENRAIVALGLRDLTLTDNQGLRALMEVSDCRSDMTSMDIGFRIAPRINAAGRMDVAKHVVELLETDDFGAARHLAGILDSRNRERQQVQQRITELALSDPEAAAGKHFVVVAGSDWHQGVIGLAASRLAERLYRPSIVLSIKDGYGHGSARSIPGFHLLEALESCSGLFEKFGGHAAAAGMLIKEGNIPALREHLNEFAASRLTEDALTPELEIDALVTGKSLDLSLMADLSAFEPFGIGNRRPVFVTRGLILRAEPFVMKEKHLKLRLSDEDGRSFEAVWWDGVARSKGQTLTPGSSIELAYVAETNTWQGNTRLQLVVEDLRTDNQP